MNAFTLRSATAADEPFLRALFHSTRAALFESMPCDEAQRALLCDMQFRAQATGHRAAYPEAEDLVVCTRDGEPVGRLMRAMSDGAIVLVDIALMPAHRGRGIGTALIRALQEHAQASGVPVLLTVERSNRARALYERLGFEAIACDALHHRMRWQPSLATTTRRRGVWTHSLEK